MDKGKSQQGRKHDKHTFSQGLLDTDPYPFPFLNRQGQDRMSHHFQHGSNTVRVKGWIYFWEIDFHLHARLCIQRRGVIGGDCGRGCV